MNKEPSKQSKNFGKKIKHLREQWNQSIKQVSNSLEVSEDDLKSIEDGKILPDPHMLDMLTSYFLLNDIQAEELKDLAFQEAQFSLDALPAGLDQNMIRQIVMLMPMDNKIIYTDGMKATVNDNGVVLHFTQNTPGQKSQTTTVSRLGMSLDHAQRMVKALESTIRQHKQSGDVK